MILTNTGFIQIFFRKFSSKHLWSLLCEFFPRFALLRNFMIDRFLRRVLQMHFSSMQLKSREKKPIGYMTLAIYESYFCKKSSYGVIFCCHLILSKKLLRISCGKMHGEFGQSFYPNLGFLDSNLDNYLAFSRTRSKFCVRYNTYFSSKEKIKCHSILFRLKFLQR